MRMRMRKMTSVLFGQFTALTFTSYITMSMDGKHNAVMDL